MLVTKPCKACGQTGKMFDIRTMKNEKCLHCNGTGIKTKEMNSCKYCGKPCYGYFCDSCGKEFEKEAED